MAAISPSPGFLAHDHHAQLAIVERVAVAGRREFERVIIIADEQQRRVDARLVRR